MKISKRANSPEVVEFQSARGRPWRPGVRNSLPWLAAAALVSVVLLTIASVIVLTVSNGQPVSDWKIQPSVLIAIFSSAVNSALVYALYEGITIAWWLEALSGSTIEALHNIWDHGNSLPHAILSGRKISRVAVAAVFATLAIIDGPLLQRASTIISKTFSSNIMVHIPVAEQLPQGFTGVVWEPSILALDENMALHQIIKNYRLRVPINSSAAALSGCRGICRGTVRAAGIVTECSTSSYHYDFSKATEAAPGLTFLVNYTVDNLDASRTPQINLSVLSTKMGTDCAGRVLSRKCSIRSATVSYPIDIVNSTITLPNLDARQVQLDPTYYNNGDFNASAGKGAGALGGIADVLLNFYNSNATIFKYDSGDPRYSYVTDWEGLVAFDYFDLSSIDAENPVASFNDSAPLTCQLSSWQDPTDDILNDLRNIMFRAALYVSESKNIHLTGMDGRYGATNISYARPFLAVNERQLLAFRTDYDYLACAAVLMLAATAAIVPTLWGWWKLGRPVTMSPVETARAFQTPLLSDASVLPTSNAVVGELIGTYGTKNVKYGKAVLNDFPGNRAPEEAMQRERTGLVIDSTDKVKPVLYDDAFDV